MGSGTKNGTMLNRMRMTSSSLKMLPKRRSDSDSTRDTWLMQLDGEHDGRNEDGRTRWHRKVLQISAQPLLFHTLDVVVHAGRQRAAHGDADIAGRRHEPRHQTHQVANQHERADGADDRHILSRFRPGEVLEQVRQERDGVLQQDLQPAGVLHVQSRSQDECQGRQRQEDEATHHQIIGDDVMGIRHLEAQRAQERRDQRAEHAVDDLDDPEWLVKRFHDRSARMPDR